MQKFDSEVEDRLAASPIAIREQISDFLVALSKAEPELRIQPGHANWNSVDVFMGSRHIIRVLAKRGLIKVDNLIPDSTQGDYGEDIELNEKGEWAYQVRSTVELPDELMLCVSDVLTHMGARRQRLRTTSHAQYGVLGKEQTAERKRSRIPSSLRFAVLVRDNYTCQYCGRSAPDVVLHVDHRLPASKGGSDDMTNLKTACVDCNLGKGNRFST